MRAHRGGQLFVASLLAAGAGAFSLPTPWRWAPLAWLLLVGSVLAVANWTCLAIFAMRGKAPSMFPLLGNWILVLAGFAVPTHSFRAWALAGLLVDPWLLATLVGVADLTVRGWRKHDSARTSGRTDK